MVCQEKYEITDNVRNTRKIHNEKIIDNFDPCEYNVNAEFAGRIE